MNLYIEHISENGNPEEEYIVLKTNGHSNYTDFALFRKIKGKQVYEMLIQLPDFGDFSNDDCLSIFTGREKTQKPINKNNKGLGHFLYLRRNTSIWHQQETEGAHLFNVKDSIHLNCK